MAELESGHVENSLLSHFEDPWLTLVHSKFDTLEAKFNRAVNKDDLQIATEFDVIKSKINNILQSNQTPKQEKISRAFKKTDSGMVLENDDLLQEISNLIAKLKDGHEIQ